MADVIRCANDGRLQVLRGQNLINGIDHLVVVDGDDVPDELRQQILLIRLVLPVAAASFDTGLGGTHRVRIRGGQRVVDPEVRWVTRLSSLDTTTIDADLTPAGRAYLDAIRSAAVSPAEWLVVMVERYGDHSMYSLRLRVGDDPPPGFDPLLSELSFSFKVDCPTPFDCVTEVVCPTVPAAEPELDYLARDFASFRRAMFDRLALIAPDDLNREAAPLRAAIVEVIAYEADRLAYFQDAVATEAYLTTARTRPSVRRHSRLLGYRMHDGCNARGYVQVVLDPGASLAGSPITPGCTMLTRLSFGGPVVQPHDTALAMSEGPEVFEVRLAPAAFSAGNNDIALYAWGDGDCCLPAGCTSAWVVDEGDLALAEGDFLLLRQTADPSTRDPADADPSLRHVVRLTSVGAAVPDPLFPGTAARLLTWHHDDALPFGLTVTVGEQPVASAGGNLVLVDHGRSVADRIEIERWGNQDRLRSTLAQADLSFAWWPPEPARDAMGAIALLDQDPRQATPLVELAGEQEPWHPVRDLLSSPPSAREFVVETENDGRARIRFGDDTNGRRPSDDSVVTSQLTDLDDDRAFVASYRVGRAAAGNVGAGAIAHLVADPALADPALTAMISSITNPIPTRGGQPAETVEEAKRDAPQAFRVQERAVTDADWIEVTERDERVQRARASRRWTGSWHTVFVTVDPVAGVEFDALRDDLAASLQRYRLAGYDLEVVRPIYVPLDIGLTVCLDPAAFRDEVEAALREEFSTGYTSDGRQGFFHPDRFTFGDSVWLGQVVARCMSVNGVAYVDVRSSSNHNRFKRRGHTQGTEIDDGRIRIGDAEIARCDADPNAPEMGTIEFHIEGGT